MRNVRPTRSNVTSRAVLFAALLVAPLGAAHAQTAEDLAAACKGCHNPTAISSDSANPIIWGQNAGYIYIQLRDFSSGARKAKVDEPMHMMATSLTDAQMLELADYVSKQPWPEVTPKGQPSAADIEEGGKVLATGGCGGCHANNFGGLFTAPRLAGQTRAYLLATFQQFVNYERKNAPDMSNMIGLLPRDKLELMAAYLETQKPTTPFVPLRGAEKAPAR